jgi:hypothetical protein
MRHWLALLLAACSGPAPSAQERSAFSVTLDAAAVLPGDEGLHCIDRPGPAADTYVSGWSVRRQGVHHVNAHIRKSGAPFADWSPCGDVFGASELLLSAASDVVEQIPNGAAFLIPGGSSLVFDVHYINTEAEPIAEHAEIDFAAGQPGELVHAMTLAQSGDALNLPPHGTGTVTFSAAPQVPIRLVSVMGHMHAHGVSETVSVGGAEVYRTGSWTEPPILHPDVTVSPEAPLTWTCAYRNESDATVQWGVTLQNTEMCQVFGLVTVNHWTATGKKL